MSIIQSCERICDTPIIRIFVQSTMQLDELKVIVENYRKATTIELAKLYNGIVDMIVVVYDGFAAHMENVRLHFIYC